MVVWKVSYERKAVTSLRIWLLHLRIQQHAQSMYLQYVYKGDVKFFYCLEQYTISFACLLHMGHWCLFFLLTSGVRMFQTFSAHRVAGVPRPRHTGAGGHQLRVCVRQVR